MINKTRISKASGYYNAQKNYINIFLEKYKIKYGTSVFYSIVFFLLGISFFSSKPITGLITILIAIILFPPTEILIKRKLNITLTKDLKALLVLVLFFIVSLSLSNGKSLNLKLSNTTAKINETNQSTSSEQVVDTKTETLVKVIKVIDGDTIVADLNGKTETIRLIGIDTPETVDPKRPVQCFGKEASAKTTELVLNKDVYLVADETQGDRDKYNRLLRYVMMPINAELTNNINEILISEGYAYEYTYAKPYKYQKEFKSAELIAKDNKKGLWDPNACK